jgi:phosphoglucosamine mutase
VAVRFGTDGIRGRVADEVTPDVAYRLGRGVAEVFDAPVFVGYDTRESSPGLAAAVLAGLGDGGAAAINLGCFTTPGVAVIAQQRVGVGVVVSASHNPYFDNGLKVLGLGGSKLDHATEEAVSAAMERAPSSSAVFLEAEVDESAERDYVLHLRSLVPTDLSAFHLVLDCANGAASRVAEELFAATGARLTMLHDRPDGRNINEGCGSIHLDDLVATVSALGADLGLAFDGDADRLIAVDAEGVVRDGDDLMVLFTSDLQRRGLLAGGLVVTTMSNLGLHRALADRGVKVLETDVGDRNVLMALDEHGWNFGGEQSGHLIFRSLAPTGDGLLTGLLLCDLVAREGPLHVQAATAWRRVPQALVNVARDRYDDAVVHRAFDELRARHQLDAADVRLLVRASGTEPVMRVMVEALDASFVRAFSERLLHDFPA